MHLNLEKQVLNVLCPNSKEANFKELNHDEFKKGSIRFLF
jgi:hypothetical protein